MGIITFPIICLLPDISGGTRQFITSTGIFFSVFSTILILHGRRAAQLLLNYDIDRDHQFTKKQISISPKNSKAEFQRQSSILKMLSENEFGGSRQNPFEAVKTKSLISRRQTCREQIQHWSKVLRHTEAMMLVQAEDESVAPASGCHGHGPPFLVPFNGSPHGGCGVAHSSASSPDRESPGGPGPGPAFAAYAIADGSLLRSALSSVIPDIASASSEGMMTVVQRRHDLTIDIESLTNLGPSNYLQDTLESDVDEETTPSESATI